MIRQKHRYILVESSQKIAEGNLDAFSAALYEALLDYVGGLQYHKVNPKVVKLADDRHFIIKSNLSGCGSLIAALALIKNVSNEATYFYTLKTSGTIRALLSNTKKSA
ncbi:MAG: Rpp14/Pop5 family protein [Candidatus Marsarchaeota archaeon]|jgi:RNase P/RNase MRP subunit POP5|nr:Rpp14/Pop5 family protein [Candidatus Marsarchaeota archaeon]MCL5115030.1 Rpp14/Pop5 family protein [Candidatus Marsarchaeota archaeon]